MINNKRECQNGIATIQQVHKGTAPGGRAACDRGWPVGRRSGDAAVAAQIDAGELGAGLKSRKAGAPRRKPPAADRCGDGAIAGEAGTGHGSDGAGHIKKAAAYFAKESLHGSGAPACQRAVLMPAEAVGLRGGHSKRRDWRSRSAPPISARGRLTVLSGCSGIWPLTGCASGCTVSGVFVASLGCDASSGANSRSRPTPGTACRWLRTCSTSGFSPRRRCGPGLAI